MNDPARWRDPEGGANAEVRALLQDDQGPVPSRAELDHIWSNLAHHLPMVPIPSHAPPAGPAAIAGTGAVVGKVTLGIALLVGTGIGARGVYSAYGKHHGAEIHTTARAPIATATPIAPVAAPAETVAAPAETVAAPMSTPSGSQRIGRSKARSAAAAPSAAKSPEVAFESPTSPASATPQSLALTNELLEESRRLADARAALRAHDPDRALALLKTGAAGSAGLGQEREALIIEALAARPSSRAAALQRARSFLRAYPQSPYRARIKGIALESE